MKQAVTVELMYGGVWNDHTSSALVRDGIEITRGRSDEQQQAPPGTCQLSFSGWEFNPENPTSDLSGLIGRNTPLRVTVGTDVRFVGEVASWTPRQSLGGDNIPPDRWVEVVAAGVTRRLGQGADPLPSAPERYILDQATPPVGFWPLDDPDGSRESRAVIGRPLRHAKAPAPLVESQRPDYGGGSVAPWLPAGIKCTSEAGTVAAPLPSPVTGPAGGWVVDVMYRADRSTGGSLPIATALIVDTGADTGGLEFRMAWGANDGFGALVLDETGATVDSDIDTDSSPLLDGQPHHVRWELTVGIGDFADFRLYVDGTEEYFASLDIGVSTVPAPGGLSLSWNGETDAQAPVQFVMLTLWGFIPDIDDTVAAAFGHQGEHAGRRVERLCGEEGITFASEGDLDDTLPLGPQYPDGLLAILREAAGVDLGDLLGARTSNAVHYRTGRSRYNQTAALALDYAQAQVAPPLEPIVDDQQTRNDVTAKRRGGGEQRATGESGPLGVDTIGRYDTSVTVGTLSDGHDLAAQAGWRLHLGTVAGTRFPRITVDLDATPTLAGDASDVDAGDLATVDNLPAELTPDLARLLVLGYTETIGSHRRRITFNCQPEEPYHIAEVEHADYSVIGSSAATLNVSMNTTETGAELHLGAGSVWVHEADYDVVTGGERMTVTGVSAASGTFPNRVQTLTVTRSVNGVVKAHAAGQRLRLFHQAYIGL